MKIFSAPTPRDIIEEYVTQIPLKVLYAFAISMKLNLRNRRLYILLQVIAQKLCNGHFFYLHVNKERKKEEMFVLTMSNIIIHNKTGGGNKETCATATDISLLSCIY